MANCPTCNRYLLGAICFNCKNSNIESGVKSEPIKDIVKLKPVIIKPIKGTTIISSNTEPKTGVPMYSKSHLNNKMHYNHNSISKQSNCIELNGKYILHSDIIIWFKNHIS